VGIHYRVDQRQSSVASSILGAFTARAVYQKDFGCLMLRGPSPDKQATAIPELDTSLMPRLPGRE
jgi:hypothetical protein